jgi:hypothetical protein
VTPSSQFNWSVFWAVLCALLAALAISGCWRAASSALQRRRAKVREEIIDAAVHGFTAGALTQAEMHAMIAEANRRN